MSTETLAMPFRGESRAPSFSGNDDESLLEFFDRFEALADECDLLEDEKCRDLLRYVDFRSKQLWLTLDSYESGDYKKFKDEVVYQYPAALKAAQRRPPQLALRCFSQKIETSVQSVPYPARHTPMHAASHPRLSELSPTAAPFCLAPVHRASLVTHLVHAPPVSCPGQPVPIRVSHPVHAVPASRTPRVRAAAVVRPGLAAPIASGDRPAPVTRHAARTVRRVHAAPVLDHAASTFRFDNPALPQLASRSAFVPLVLSPPPLPFSLCPAPAPSASVIAHVQPSPFELTQHAVTPVSRDSREVSLNAEHALVESQKQEVVNSQRRGDEDEQDVAVKREEGRGWKINIASDDESERHRLVKKPQDDRTQLEITLQSPDENIEQDRSSESAGESGEAVKRREAADEQVGSIHGEQLQDATDERRRTADEERVEIADEECIEFAEEDRAWIIVEDRIEIAEEDRTWIADEDWICIADEEHLKPEERQKRIENIQLKNTNARKLHEEKLDVLPAPALLPAPEPPPECLADPRSCSSIKIIPARISFPHRQHEDQLEYCRTDPALARHIDWPISGEPWHVSLSHYTNLKPSPPSPIRAKNRHSRAQYSLSTMPASQSLLSPLYPHFPCCRSTARPFSTILRLLESPYPPLFTSQVSSNVIVIQRRNSAFSANMILPYRFADISSSTAPFVMILLPPGSSLSPLSTVPVSRSLPHPFSVHHRPGAPPAHHRSRSRSSVLFPIEVTPFRSVTFAFVKSSRSHEVWLLKEDFAGIVPAEGNRLGQSIFEV